MNKVAAITDFLLKILAVLILFTVLTLNKYADWKANIKSQILICLFVPVLPVDYKSIQFTVLGLHESQANNFFKKRLALEVFL